MGTVESDGGGAVDVALFSATLGTAVLGARARSALFESGAEAVAFVIVSDGEATTTGVSAITGTSADGFNKTTARATRLTANRPSSAQTHVGVLPFERGKAVGGVDGFC